MGLCNERQMQFGKNKVWLQSTKVIFMKNAGHSLKRCRSQSLSGLLRSLAGTKVTHCPFGTRDGLLGCFRFSERPAGLGSPWQWSQRPPRAFVTKRKIELSASWHHTITHLTRSSSLHNHTQGRGHCILGSCVLKPFQR